MSPYEHVLHLTIDKVQSTRMVEEKQDLKCSEPYASLWKVLPIASHE